MFQGQIFVLLVVVLYSFYFYFTHFVLERGKTSENFMNFTHSSRQLSPDFMCTRRENRGLVHLHTFVVHCTSVKIKETTDGGPQVCTVVL